MEWISNCFTKAAQRVIGFSQHVISLISHIFFGRPRQSEAVLINVNQSDAGVSDITFLAQTPIGSQSTCSFDIENPSSLSLIEEVVNNGNILVTDQTHVGVSNTTTFSLIHQTPVRAHATNSFNRENPRRFSPNEGEQDSPGVGIAVLGSQHSEPPSRPNAGHDIDIQALIAEAKEVASWVTFISSGGIFSEMSGVIGNEEAALVHEYFFKAFMILCYSSLALGLGLHRLIKISPKTRGFVMMVKIIIYLSQGSLVYAISFAICLLFPSKVGVVFILVAPLIPIGLIATLSFAHRQHGSIP